MSDVLTQNSTKRKEGNQYLSGIVTPVITPLAQSDRLDLDTTSVLFDRLICGGVSGLFLLGTTGEFAGMSHQLRQRFVQEASRIVGGRVPLFVGVSDTSFDESVDLGRLAADCGATALVVTAPYYYRFPGNVMRTYLTQLAHAMPIPLILYNMPGNTKVVFDEETIKFVVDTPDFIGIKDSGGDLDYFARLCRIAAGRDDFSVMMGPDRLLGKAIGLGAAGGVNSGSNLCPELFVKMYHAAREGNEQLMALYQPKIDLIHDLYHTVENGLSVTTGIKTALELLGIGRCSLVKPFTSPAPGQIEVIRDLLSRLLKE